MQLPQGHSDASPLEAALKSALEPQEFKPGEQRGLEHTFPADGLLRKLL